MYPIHLTPFNPSCLDTSTFPPFFPRICAFFFGTGLYRAGAEDLLRHADKTLATYMQGQLMIAAILGVLTFLGYLVIGLPNSFILAAITMVTSFIPIFGAFLGAIPAALIGLGVSPLMLLKVCIVLVAVQQLEGNLISPRLQGARMHIHPLMVFFVVIASYMLFGVLGSLFAVPAYAVLRAKTFWAERWMRCGQD
ncbi:MAG: AI-2E family transporter [Bacteroidota bacterium]